MNKEASTVETETSDRGSETSAEQVVEYLRRHKNFFVHQSDLLAEISLPHASGKAISLLERQVNILRERGIEARQRLNNLLSNARNNDELFDTTRNLVLSLLRAENITEIFEASQDQLSNHADIDACELILVAKDGLNVSPSIRTQANAKLQQDFADVYRLKRTYCGTLTDQQIAFLFPAQSKNIKSTAICPVMDNGEILALLAIGHHSEQYFNVNLDTLFLDFMARVIGAVLNREITRSA